MHGKAIWKPGISEIAKASRGTAPEPHKKGRLQHPKMNPQLYTCWVMAYDHKTQSFM